MIFNWISLVSNAFKTTNMHVLEIKALHADAEDPLDATTLMTTLSRDLQPATAPGMDATCNPTGSKPVHVPRTVITIARVEVAKAHPGVLGKK